MRLLSSVFTFALTSVVVSALSGCMAMGSPFQTVVVPPNKSIVYVYRPYQYRMSQSLTEFVMDDGQSARVEANGYSYFIVSPGPHQIRQTWVNRTGTFLTSDPIDDRPIDLTFLAFSGDAAYFRLDSEAGRYGMQYRRSWSLKRIAAEEAMDQIAKTRYSPATLDSKRAPAAPQQTPNNAVTIDSLKGLLPK